MIQWVPRKCRAHTVTAMATEAFQEEREMQCVLSLCQCLMDKHGNVQRFNTGSSPHSSTHGHWGAFRKIKKSFSVIPLLWFTPVRPWDKAAFVWPNMPFCASHFNLWGLGEDNSGRIILPPFFQLWGNLVFWQLSAFASQTWLTLVLTRSPSLHLWSNFP